MLSEYSAFIAKVRELAKQGEDREEAMKQAIKYCRKHDILKEFLKEHGAEVINMLLTEWNLEDARAVWFEDGERKGLEKGLENVARNALCEGATIEFVQRITGAAA